MSGQHTVQAPVKKNLTFRNRSADFSDSWGRSLTCLVAPDQASNLRPFKEVSDLPHESLYTSDEIQ